MAGIFISYRATIALDMPAGSTIGLATTSAPIKLFKKNNVISEEHQYDEVVGAPDRT